MRAPCPSATAGRWAGTKDHPDLDADGLLAYLEESKQAEVQSSRSLWWGQRRRTTVTTACRVVPATTSTMTSPLAGV
ncbi:hypothetical protein [Streptomyces mirabilis]|uniref:hypothetical protein n=1 Tax=Streptomyces mirabilis TaxID=68239 RepID=UPI0036AF1190